MRGHDGVETSIPHIPRRTSRIAVGSSTSASTVTTQLNNKKMNEFARAMKSSNNMLGGSGWISNAGYRTRRRLSTGSLKSNGLAIDSSQTFMFPLNEEDNRTFGDEFHQPSSSLSSSNNCHFSARLKTTGSSVS